MPCRASDRTGGMRGEVITTHRALIRPLAGGDEALFCRLFSDRQTMQFISSTVSVPRSARDFAAALRAANRDPIRELFFAVTEGIKGEAIGICSVQRIDLIRKRAEIGVILQPAWQGKGFGKEIILALTSSALRTLPIDEIWAQYDVRNEAAAALFATSGFQPGRADPEEELQLTGARWCFFRRDKMPDLASQTM
jgi:[ribosomal protein S5]-alanine N-acetyltransferase